jgi:hypothetical protein
MNRQERIARRETRAQMHSSSFADLWDKEKEHVSFRYHYNKSRLEGA